MSPLPPISGSVRRFVADHIPSIERLEILLLLAEAKTRSWSLPQIEERIRSTADSVRRNVSSLVEQQLIVPTRNSPAAFRYAAEPAVDELVKKLANAYRTYRVTTIELIYSQQRTTERTATR